MSYSDADITSLLDDLHSIGHYETPEEEARRLLKEWCEDQDPTGVRPSLIHFLLDKKIPHTYILSIATDYSVDKPFILLLPVIRGYYIKNRSFIGLAPDIGKDLGAGKYYSLQHLSQVEGILKDTDNWNSTNPRENYYVPASKGPRIYYLTNILHSNPESE